MGYEFEGYKRLTTCQDLAGEDKEEHVGRFRVLNSRHIAATGKAAEYGETGKTFVTVRAPRGVSRQDVAIVLQETFTFGCRCGQDCCGHVQHQANSPIHVRKRQWVVPVRGYRNI